LIDRTSTYAGWINLFVDLLSLFFNKTARNNVIGLFNPETCMHLGYHFGSLQTFMLNYQA